MADTNQIIRHLVKPGSSLETYVPICPVVLLQTLVLSKEYLYGTCIRGACKNQIVTK